jgi:hypothetical protein
VSISRPSELPCELQMLQGIKPADLPAQQATEVELSLNLKAARARPELGTLVGQFNGGIMKTTGDSFIAFLADQPLGRVTGGVQN